MTTSMDEDDPFGIGKFDELEREPPRRETRTEWDRAPIPGREAAIAYAVCSRRSYAELFCEQLSTLNFSAPLVRSAVAWALAMSPGAAESSIMDAVFQAIPRPLPGYLRRDDPKAFAEVLAIQAERENMTRLRNMA